jgi:hypothetical protein
LQEALEDYLLECFNDGYILAAHAHRVTVMHKDLNTLMRLRHRDPLTHPIDFVDEKMKKILEIPPARKAKDKILIEEVFEDDLHDHGTRLNMERWDVFNTQKKTES